MAVSASKTDVASNAGSTTSSITFSGVALGAAASDREIYVAVASFDDTNTSQFADSLTIAGVAATKIVGSQQTTLTRTRLVWFWALVPTGPSGNIVATFTNNGSGFTNTTLIEVYRAVGADTVSPVSDAAIQSGGGSFSPALGSITIPTGGVMLVASIARETATPVFSFFNRSSDDGGTSGITTSSPVTMAIESGLLAGPGVITDEQAFWDASASNGMISGIAIQVPAAPNVYDPWRQLGPVVGYNSNPPHFARQPLEARKLTPPQSGPAPNNPPFAGSRVGQAVLNCWAFAAAVAAIMPIVAANLDPPQDGAVRFVVTGTRVPQAVHNAWIPPPPAPIVARNLNPPISGPVPQNPPLVGMKIPAAVHVAWIPPPPAPIVAVNMDPPISGPQNPPLIGMRIPVAVQVAWIPPPPAPIVARNLTQRTPPFRSPRLVDEPIYLLEVEVYNPNTLLVETKRFSTRSKTTRPNDTPASTVYDGRMNNAGQLDRKLFDNGGTIGSPSINVGFFELNNADGSLSYLFDYGVDGRTFTLRLLADYDDYVTTATTVFIGTLRGLASPDLRKSLQLRIRDKMEELQVPLLTSRYGGGTNSGGTSPIADGDSTMLNMLIPQAYGSSLFIEPLCVNAYDLIYQVNDGAIPTNGLNVYDGGAALTFDGDFATMALLQAAVITAGRYATCKAFGCFRLQATPAHRVFASVEAESSSWAAGFDLYEPGPIAKRILTRAGKGADLEVSSFDNLMTTPGNGAYRCGNYITDSKTVLDIVSEVLASVGAGLISTAQNTLKAVVLSKLPLPAVTVLDILIGETPLDTFTERDIGKDGAFTLAAPPQAEGDGAPAWWINFNYSYYYATLGKSDLAGSVALPQQRDYGQQWRTTVATNSAIRTAHPLAPTLTFNSKLTRLIGVTRQSEHLLNLYGQRRDYIKITLPASVVDRTAVIDLGAIVALEVDRLGYSPKNFYVIGRLDDFGKKLVTLTLWG